MNEWLGEKRKKAEIFFSDYGKLLIVAFLLVSIAPLILIFISFSSEKPLRVSFLDIGQGDAILIQTPSGHDMLIDGGPSDKVLERLASELGYFDHHIDVVVSTHPDADHITGLIPTLLHYDVDHIIVSPIKGHTGVFEELEKSINEEQATIHTGKKGDEINFGDGVVAHILYPSANYHGSEKETNDASVSVVIIYGEESVLLTGDLPSTYERELLQEILPKHVTIYKAGHHGSKYSSGDVLLSYIHPEYSVVSAGKDNRYGHPNPEALGRLKAYSQEILSTIDRGTITFLLDGTTVQTKTAK